MDAKINFSSHFKKANFFSLILFSISILLITFKGLNFGIDFKGGTLIELRVVDQKIGIKDIRDSFSSKNLGDVNVKEFGQKGDYLIKIEQKLNSNTNFIPELKKTIINSLNTEVNFRRVENVGPKVSAELLESGLIAIT